MTRTQGNRTPGGAAGASSGDRRAAVGDTSPIPAAVPGVALPCVPRKRTRSPNGQPRVRWDAKVSAAARDRYRARAAAEGLTEGEWHRRMLAYADMTIPPGWPDSVTKRGEVTPNGGRAKPTT